MAKDMIEKPSHYQGKHSLEAIEVARNFIGGLIGIRAAVVAVSKEVVPDKELIRVDEQFLEYGLEDFKMDVGQVWAVIQGEAKPTKCGKCDYCRAHKQLSRMVSLSDLIYGD